MTQLKIVKAVVFALTVLLFCGILALITLVTLRINGADRTEVLHSLQEPAGSQIAQVSGGGDLLYITIRGGGQPDRIVVYDRVRGQKLSYITIN